MKKMKKFPKVYNIINEKNNRPAMQYAKVIDGYILATDSFIGVKLPIEEFGMPDGSVYTKEQLKLISGAKNSLKFNDDSFEVDGGVYKYTDYEEAEVDYIMNNLNGLFEVKRVDKDATLNSKLLKKITDCFDGDIIKIINGVNNSLIMSKANQNQMGVIMHIIF